MYQSGAMICSAQAVPGGSASGRIHSGIRCQECGRQPWSSIRTVTAAENSQKGTSSRRSRPRTTDSAGRCRECAARDPARANMMPMDGKTRVSQAQPKVW